MLLKSAASEDKRDNSGVKLPVQNCALALQMFVTKHAKNFVLTQINLAFFIS